jgi:CheY-like chemotaxis protein
LANIVRTVAFVGGRHEAVQAMERRSFNAVLRDTRIPGRDAAPILRTMKQTVSHGPLAVAGATKAARRLASDDVAGPRAAASAAREAIGLFGAAPAHHNRALHGEQGA